MSKTYKLTLVAFFISIGTFTGNLLYIPVGVSKMFPVQHAINVLSAVLLGPVYPMINAFMISILRNILGTGTLLAFPGSMIGALLAGVAYYFTKSIFLSAIGEVIGTGILGALASYPIVTLLLGQKVAATFYIIPFLLSTVGGSVIAVLLLYALNQNKALQSVFKGQRIQKQSKQHQS